jgi:hypothetical protein
MSLWVLPVAFLLTAIHHAGLVALTHTPNPMNFLTKILKRPENERPYLLIPVGYPAKETFVPKLGTEITERGSCLLLSYFSYLLYHQPLEITLGR